MLLVKPSFEILDEIDGEKILRSIERAGRTCYKSEDRITEGSAVKFAGRILSLRHESVLEHEKVSVRIICDRGVSHEIVRHRLASYSQESTRYCDYIGDVTFVIPPWVNIAEGHYQFVAQIDAATADDPGANIWAHHCMICDATYGDLELLDDWTPEKARSVLPNSLKTEIVMTANLREWRHFFKLRTAPAAHPQMREIAIPLLKRMRELIPVVFDDIEVA